MPGLSPTDYAFMGGSEIFSALADYLGGGEARKWSKENKGVARAAGAKLDQGITTKDVAGLFPAVYNAALPGINATASRAVGRFGSRSGKASGAIAGAIGQGVAPGITQLLQMMLANNQQNQRTRYTSAMAASA